MNTQKKLVVFDMDDTLITSNTWLRFNMFLGVSEADDYRLYKAFAEKEITYKHYALCTKLTISPKTECIAVGDSSNDIPLFVETGCGITFTWAKEPVQAASVDQIETLCDLPKALQALL